MDWKRASKTRRVCWIFLWAILISSVYLPSLGTRFDFADDSTLVYPAPQMPFGERVGFYWKKVVANYEALGPFRPVLWAHWELQADMFGANELAWRLSRWVWTALAAASLLWLMLELNIAPMAAVAATALAMWSPYRGEIWLSLTLAEGVAMPYAIFALVCAVRASRSPRARLWDLAGFISVLAALGCKNTFAALVPAQLLLRVIGGGASLLDGLRRHGLRAALLTLTLLFPIGHFIYFQTHWQPGQYPVEYPSWARLGSAARLLRGTMNLDFIAPGLFFAFAAISGIGLILDRKKFRPSFLALSKNFAAEARPYRLALAAGMALLVFGVAIYLPVRGEAGRYSIPAIWGVDLWIGALLSMLAQSQLTAWKRLAYVAFGCGLAGVMIASVGKQDRFAAKNRMLWRGLEYVERQAPKGASIAWLPGTELRDQEAVHFDWHLEARGRGDLSVQLINPDGTRVERTKVYRANSTNEPAFLVTESRTAPHPEEWDLVEDFGLRYRWGARRFLFYLWKKKAVGNAAAQ